MKRVILHIIFTLMVFPLAAQYVVRGGDGIPLLAEANTANRLEVYLVNGLSGAEISFTSSESGAHHWYRYDEKANESTPIACRQMGNTSTITNLSDGCGYFVGLPTEPSTSYVWIFDYSRYVPSFISMIPEETANKCAYLNLVVDAEAAPLYYKTPLGSSVELRRTYHLLYDNLEWQEENLMFVDKLENEELKGDISSITISAPLKDTSFTLTTDDFSSYFGLGQSISSNLYEALAIDPHGFAESINADGEREEHFSGSVIAGSAPIEVTFTAYSNEPVTAFYVWKINKIDAETGESKAIARYTERELNYTFLESGRFEIELETLNSKAVCENNSETFTVTTEETYLFVPNAFSPGTSIGTNDEFKVSYKSIISFKCSIYNRWGNLLYQWTDPAKGWDGKVKGKYVPTGAYYYVIEYKGGDGKKRTKSGDVNVLRSKDQY